MTKRISATLLVLVLMFIFSVPIASAADQEPQYGGTLIYSTSGQQYETDMYPPTAINTTIFVTARPALEPLFKLKSDGTVEPFLVKEYSVSEDGMAYTFSLQPHVMFSDGTPFNAEAVKWNIEQTQAEGLNTAYDKVASVEVVDDTTCILHMTEPDLFFINFLASVHASMMVSPTAVETNGKEWAQTHPVGTGPFVLEKWDHNVEMVYTRNENYWQEGLPYLDGITIHYIPDDVVLSAAFRNGEVDMLYGTSSQLIRELSDSYQITVMDFPNIAVNAWFSSKNEDSPLSDPLVRKAVCYAIDMPAIITSLYSAEYKPTNQLSYEGSLCWNDDIEGYEYNPEKAKELLKEAGYENGFETTYFVESNETYAVMAEAIQAYLAAVGIDMKIDLIDPARYFENVMLNSWGDGIAQISYTYTPDELCSIRRMLDPATSIFAHSIDYPQDYSTMLKEMVSSDTIDTAIERFKAIDDYLIDDLCLLMPLFVNNVAVTQQDYVHNIGTGVDGEDQIRSWAPEQAWLSK